MFVVPTTSADYAAVCVIKVKDDALKLCTFKVASEDSGYRYGELLLRASFDHCRTLGLRSCYLTVFEEHQALISMLEAFGFQTELERTATGELLMTKRFVPPPDAPAVGPLTHHITYGPGAIIPTVDQIFVVPVQPQWARWLLPDAEAFQHSLFAPKPFANALRKAYLSNASARTMRPGATLLFYLSQRDKTVRAVGVLEDLLVSRRPAELALFVGKRTVYSLSDIADMCERRDVLALLFRQDRVLDDPVTLHELASLGLRGPPQSVTTLHGQEAATWLSQRLAA